MFIHSQLATFGMLNVLYLCCHVVVKPFADAIDIVNTVEFVSLLVLTVLGMSLIYMQPTMNDGQEAAIGLLVYLPMLIVALAAVFYVLKWLLCTKRTQVCGCLQKGVAKLTECCPGWECCARAHRRSDAAAGVGLSKFA